MRKHVNTNWMRGVALAGALLMVPGAAFAADKGASSSSDDTENRRLDNARQKVAENIVKLESSFQELESSLRSRLQKLGEKSADEKARLEKELSEAQDNLKDSVAKLKKTAGSQVDKLEKDIDRERKKAGTK